MTRQRIHHSYVIINLGLSGWPRFSFLITQTNPEIYWGNSVKLRNTLRVCVWIVNCLRSLESYYCDVSLTPGRRAVNKHTEFKWWSRWTLHCQYLDIKRTVSVWLSRSCRPAGGDGVLADLHIQKSANAEWGRRCRVTYRPFRGHQSFVGFFSQGGKNISTNMEFWQTEMSF